jgi:hypothetical protein
MGGGEADSEASGAVGAAAVPTTETDAPQSFDPAVEDRSVGLLNWRHQAIKRGASGTVHDRLLAGVSESDVRLHMRAAMEITGACLSDYAARMPPPNEFDRWFKFLFDNALKGLMGRRQQGEEVSSHLLLCALQSISGEIENEARRVGVTVYGEVGASRLLSSLWGLGRIVVGGLIGMEATVNAPEGLREATLLSKRSSSQNGALGAQKRHEANNARRQHYISFLDEHRDYFTRPGLLVKQIVAAIRDAEQGRSAFGWTLEPHPNGVLSTSALERLVSDWEKARGYVRRPGPPRKRRDRG